MKPLKLLIDADFFFYRAAAAAELELDYSQDLTVVVGNFSQGKKIVETEISQLCERFDTDDVLLAFTDQKNFRKCVDETYKGNRTKRKPAGYLKLKNWGMFNWPSLMKPALEADDVLGVISTNGSIKNFVLISPDKDMEQIPCRLYNLKEEWTQTPEAAKRKLYQQTLEGDQCDGYRGCHGVGPKSAEKILAKVEDGDYWPAVVDAYLKAGQTEADALRTIRLARILQAEDWDSVMQQPILFTP
jgi:DNA polymerase-1|tara:strand:+ start:5213 stop:5944 length:732 start_codon:yes stop_codon:yes gene_type:complete